MNFLAHAYLSFQDDEILAGNFAGDFIKGKAWEKLPYNLAKGVLLHREIDYFTDTHPEFIYCKRMFSRELRHYSSLFPDLVFDHFLANDSSRFTNDSLKDFSERVYGAVELNMGYFPREFSFMFFRMKTGNWLYGYRFKGGIENSIRGMVRKANAPFDEMRPVEIFRENYPLLQESYRRFFPELESFVKELLSAGS